MRTSYKALLLFLSSLLALLLFSLPALPKLLILDRFLLEEKLFVRAKSSSEGATELLLRRGEVYKGNLLLLSFDTARILLRPLYVLITFRCGSGSASLKLTPDGLKEVNLKNFGCVNSAESISGSIALRDGLFGELTLSGLELRGTKVDGLRIRFLGNSFEGEINYMGMKLKGGGVVSAGRDILSSRVDGEFRSGSVRVRVRGELGNLNVSLR
ncbi:MAG: hypothetical protein GXO04_02840 [Aquificae bacterium]|nr:hypothetical protein [Aquificota bacterium]